MAPDLNSRHPGWLCLPGLLLVGLPLLGLLWALAGADWSSVGQEPFAWGTLLTLLEVLAWSLGWALLPGLAVGLSLTVPRSPPSPGRLLWLALPLAVPAYLYGSAWQDLLALAARALGSRPPESGAWLAGLAMASARWPLLAACTAACVAQQRREPVEAALLVGGPWCARRMLVRLTRRGWLTGVLVFVLVCSADHFTPELCGLRTPALVFFEAMQRYADPLRALKAALPLLLGLAVLAWLLGRSAARHPLAAGLGAARGAAAQRGGWLPLLLAVALSTAPVLGLLVYRAGSFDELLMVFWKPLRNGVALAGGCAVLACGGACLSVLAGASPGLGQRLDRWLGRAALLAFVLPGSLLAVGSLRVGGPSGLLPLYRSPLLLILSLSAGQLWLARELLRAGLAGIPRSQLEAARLAGAGWLRIGTRLLLPALLPWLAASALLIAWFCFFDVSQAPLLQPPGWQPFAVNLGNKLHYGTEELTAAGALLGVGLDLSLLLLLTWLFGGRRRKSA